MPPQHTAGASPLPPPLLHPRRLESVTCCHHQSVTFGKRGNEQWWSENHGGVTFSGDRWRPPSRQRRLRPVHGGVIAMMTGACARINNGGSPEVQVELGLLSPRCKCKTFTMVITERTHVSKYCFILSARWDYTRPSRQTQQ